MIPKLSTLVFLIVLPIAISTANLYGLLEITQEATSDQIKKAFRKLSIKYHPDRNTDNPQMQKHYLEIQRAFQILIDVSKRNTYDLWGEEGLKELDKNPKRKGGDYRPQMSIRLQNFYTGAQQVFNFRRGEICKFCKGTGDQSGAVKTCPVCSGVGKMVREVRVHDKFKKVQMKCKECKGIGIGSTNKCPVCKGQKVTLKPRDLKFTIEKGMNDGDKVVFKGESQQGFDFYPGDVILTLRQMGHSTFTRDGNDLRMSLTISLKQAILGLERTVKHLDGRNIDIVSDYNIQNGEEIRIKNSGMPIRGQIDQFGDLIVKVSISYPKSYTSQQINEIQEICGESSPDQNQQL